MSVTRIVRLSAADSALSRLSLWWDGLSRRERILVATLGVLLSVALVTYGIVKPLQAARAQAFADIRTYETLNARLRAAGPNLKAAAPQRSGTPVDVVTQSATLFGFTVQATPAPAGASVSVAATGVPYDAAVAWVADVERTSTLRPVRVAFTRAAIGRVDLQATFQ